MNSSPRSPFRFHSLLALVVATVVLASLQAGVVGAAGAPSIRASALLELLEGRDSVFQPQFLVEDDGTLLVLWREATGRESDLYVAHATAEGEFSEPVRVNHEAGAVSGMDLDETRAAFVAGPGGLLGVAWGGRGSIWAAVGHDHGTSWEPAVALTEAEPAYRGFVSIDFDSTGALHGAWIDGRIAPAGMEEPADLYHSILRDGQAREQNLTADQEASICGCCRTHVDVDSTDTVRITFRNAADGHRDIYRADLTADGTRTAFRRTGPAMWELRGCPVQGPITVGDVTLFNEASTGKRRLVAARAGDSEYSVVAEDGDDWRIASPPRAIAGAERALLLPGRPHGRVLLPSGDGWTAAGPELPVWATAAVRNGDRLVVVGALSGAPHVAEMAWPAH